MATDGLLNDNREEIKKKEFFEKLDNYGFTVLCEECKIEGCNQEPDQDLVWNWIQAYVKKEVERSKDNSELVEEVLVKDNTNIECRVISGKWDNEGGTCLYCGKRFGSVLDFLNHIIKQETNDV